LIKALEELILQGLFYLYKKQVVPFINIKISKSIFLNTTNQVKKQNKLGT